MATGAAFEPIIATTSPSFARLRLPVPGEHRLCGRRPAEHMSPVDAG